MLLDRRLRYHQIGSDLPRRRGRDERLVGQGWAAQRGENIEFAACQLRSGGPPQFHVGRYVLVRDAADPAAGGAEADDIAIFQDAAGDGPAVHPRAIP